MTTITILGLGEAGHHYAHGLAAAGARVRGYDPHRELADPLVTQVLDLESAVAGADVVLSLVAGHIAASVADDAMPSMSAGSVYADLNSGAPEVKRQIADAAEGCRVLMADVAVLAPVGRAGHRTQLLATGAGARAFADALRPLGVPIDVREAPAGEAARLRLLRSVFMKGLAALTLESLGAARTAGVEDWLRAQLAAELGPGGDELVDRLVSGTPHHAQRRLHEVRAAAAELDALGAPSDMTRATLTWLERLVTSPDSDRG